MPVKQPYSEFAEQYFNQPADLGKVNRLNSQGQAVGKTNDPHQSRIGVRNKQQVGVLYGHQGSGKVYNYLAENKRVGDIVTPDVTHPKSGKTYKTLGRIVSTRQATGSPAQDTSAHLSGKGIMLKTIGDTDQKSLPGYYEGWSKDAKAQKDLYDEARLSGASDDRLKDVKNFTTGARADSKQRYEELKRKKIQALKGEQQWQA